MTLDQLRAKRDEAAKAGDHGEALVLNDKVRALKETIEPTRPILNPWTDIPRQYRGKWAYDYDEKNSEFFVHCGGYGICRTEDSEVAHAICKAYNSQTDAVG